MKERIIDEEGRHITRMELSDLGPMTGHEREMIRQASKRKVEYDEDCPPLTPAMIAEAERMIAARSKRA